MKKIISFILLTMLPIVASAYKAYINGIYYNLSGSEAEVTYVGYSWSYNSFYSDYSGAVVIPSSVTYDGNSYSVTSFGEYAFAKCSGLTSITIPNSVISIGKCAFDGCTGLTSITIPTSVTSIGVNAFSNCSGLTKVIVPDIAAWCGISFGYSSANPLYYAHHLYSNEGTEITNLIIPNSVTSIGEYNQEIKGVTNVEIIPVSA